jgi:acyl-CoA synthetase (NDP forming)
MKAMPTASTSLTSNDPARSISGLSGLFRPRAVTLVGASEKSHVTRVLLANFTREDCPFSGAINLVNPNQSQVMGRPAVSSLAQVEGDLGLVYLLVGSGTCLAILEEAASMSLGSRMAGVVVYAAGFGEAGAVDEQAALVEAGKRLGVPMLGPQSTGLISRWSRLLGITDPVPETFVDGRVAFIAQSTGLLGGAVSWLFRRGVGLAAGVGFGNGAAIGYNELASALLLEPDVDVVCVYADTVGTIDNLVQLGVAAQQSAKPTVILSAASAPTAQRAARSHTGMLATPSRIVRGVAKQYGLLLVNDFEELLWAAELFVHPGVRQVTNPGVGVFTASGGGGIIAAEAIERAGLPMNEPTIETRVALGLTSEQLANPFDIGAISLDRPDDYHEKLRIFASDERYGVVLRPASLGAPSERLADHNKSLTSFVEGVMSVHKLPLIAFPFHEDLREYRDVITWPEVLVVGGSSELQAKLSLLTAWAAQRNPASLVRLGASHVKEEEGSDDHSSIADSAATRQLLNSRHLSWPRGILVDDPQSLPSALEEFGWTGQRLVAKTALALPHRAVAGGVVLGLATIEEIAAAVTLLHARFGCPTMLLEEVAFSDSYFVGLQRIDNECLLAFGAGTATNSSDVDTRLCPLDRSAATRLVDDTREGGVMPAPDGLIDLLVELSETMIAHPEIDVVDVNPLVVDSVGRLVVLDAKIYVHNVAEPGGIGVAQ